MNNVKEKIAKIINDSKWKKVIGFSSIILCFVLLFLLYQYMNSENLQTDINYIKKPQKTSHKNKFSINSRSSYSYNKTQPLKNTTINVYICGSVRMPGVYKAYSSETLNDLIIKNGGYSKKADINRVNLAKTLKNGEKVYIPYLGEKDKDISKYNGDTTNESISENVLQMKNPAVSGTSISSSGNSGKINAESNRDNSKDRININSATEEQLDSIPGIGPKKAKAIIDYRNAHGGFKTINELDNVNRIGAKTIEDIKGYICVN